MPTPVFVYWWSICTAVWVYVFIWYFHIQHPSLYKRVGLSLHYELELASLSLLFSFLSQLRFHHTPPDTHTRMHGLAHTIPFLPAAIYVTREIGWISCAIPYGGLSCSIWSQPWMKEPVSHRRFVLLHLSRSAVAHFPLSLRPYCQPTDAMPFKLPLAVVHCLPHSCTSQHPHRPPPPLTPWQWERRCVPSALLFQSVPTSLSFMNILCQLYRVMDNFSHHTALH